jgi:hypothetical protein
VLLLTSLLGLTWLTNVPASLVSCYGLFAVAAICSWDQRSIRPIVRFLLAESFAVALSAFYLLPLWLERKWIDTTKVAKFFTWQGLLFMSRPGSGGQSFLTFSCWIFASVYILLIAATLWNRSDRLRESSSMRTWVYLALVSFFFQLPLAILLWKYLPQLYVVGYPFRFMPLMGAALPLILLAKGARQVMRKTAYSAIASMTLLLLVGSLLQERTKNLRLPPFSATINTWSHDGYLGAPGIFLPAGAKLPVHASLVSDIALSEQPGSGCKILTMKKGYASRDLVTDSQGECAVRLPIFFYPYWRAADESDKPLLLGRDADGLLLVTVPVGRHAIHLAFRAASVVRSVSAGVSLVAVIMLALGLGFSLRRERMGSNYSAAEVASRL